MRCLMLGRNFAPAVMWLRSNLFTNKLSCKSDCAAVQNLREKGNVKNRRYFRRGNRRLHRRLAMWIALCSLA